MKALIGAFNKENGLEGGFAVPGGHWGELRVGATLGRSAETGRDWEL